MARTYAIQKRHTIHAGDSTITTRVRRFAASRSKAFVFGALGVALAIVFVSGASALEFRSPSHSSSAASVAQPGTWTVPSNEASAPFVPTPGGAEQGVGSFNDVTCPTASNCVAVGGDSNLDGVAATSSDGGSSWTSASVEIGQPELDAVSCFSASNCVAVGVGDGATSSDGGASWTSVSIPTPNTTLLGVSCPTSLFCVGVGVTPVEANPYQGEVLVSSDGGSTWSTPQLPAYVGALGSVDCPSASFCVAVGAEILVSNDGGLSWSPEFVDGGTGVLRNVSCSSATTCVAVGPNGQGAGDPTAAAFAVSTTDGGSTWAPVAMPTGSYTLNAIDCSSDGSCISSGPGPNSTAPEALSTDGGATWSEGSSLPPDLSAVANISCQSSTQCVLVGLEGSSSVTASSSDGTWSVQPVTTIGVMQTGVSQ
jgi:photosystem II stability/assembly factor-like uncharacterized protein